MAQDVSGLAASLQLDASTTAPRSHSSLGRGRKSPGVYRPPRPSKGTSGRAAEVWQRPVVAALRAPALPHPVTIVSSRQSSSRALPAQPICSPSTRPCGEVLHVIDAVLLEGARAIGAVVGGNDGDAGACRWAGRRHVKRFFAGRCIRARLNLARRRRSARARRSRQETAGNRGLHAHRNAAPRQPRQFAKQTAVLV